MKRQVPWLIFAIVELASIQPAPFDRISEEPGLRREHQESVDLVTHKFSARSPDGGLSCRLALPGEARSCTTLERSILDTVVRLEVRAPDGKGGWEGGKGHATVMRGRYLVTHNHFSVRLSTFESMENNGAAAVSLYRADGEKILLEAPPTIFKVIAEDSQSLVLDFGTDEAGQGFFEGLGLASADLIAWQDLQLEPGIEVAQVDWDGRMAHVDWVLVEEVFDEGGTRVLVLSDGLLQGASGGGVFWQGYHIANNWQTVEVLDEGGSLVRQFSKAALNAHNVTSLSASGFAVQPMEPNLPTGD